MIVVIVFDGDVTARSFLFIVELDRIMDDVVDFFGLDLSLSLDPFFKPNQETQRFEVQLCQ